MFLMKSPIKIKMLKTKLIYSDRNPKISLFLEKGIVNRNNYN